MTLRSPIRTIRLAALVAIATCWSAQLPAQPQQEDELRAGLILGFARFTEWPVPQREGPIVVCVVGHPRLAAALERISAGKLINGRSASVRQPKTAPFSAGCHILYVGRLPGAKAAAVIRESAVTGLLLIGEDDKLQAAGAAVQLFEEDGRMSFEVNLSALQGANLSISSKLLRLGYTTRDTRRGRVTP